MSAFLSLLVPTYEPRFPHLKAALDSAMLQTHKRWELLIHDDASQADVRAMAEPYLQDARVRFVRSPRRLGIGGNWNACLAQANGDFVQYLFQDDVWDTAYLERAVHPLTQDAGLGFVATNHAYRIEGTSHDRNAGYAAVTALKREHLRAGHQRSRDFLRWWIARGLRPNVIGEPSFVLLRRGLMEELGPFREDLPQGLDVEYWVRAMLRKDWYYVADELGFFRVHADAASARNEEEGKGLFDRLRLFDLLLRELPRGELRALAQASLRSQLAEMTAKFFARTKAGKNASTSGSNALIDIALRHPVLTVGGMLEYMRKAKK